MGKWKANNHTKQVLTCKPKELVGRPTLGAHLRPSITPKNSPEIRKPYFSCLVADPGRCKASKILDLSYRHAGISKKQAWLRLRNPLELPPRNLFSFKGTLERPKMKESPEKQNQESQHPKNVCESSVTLSFKTQTSGWGKVLGYLKTRSNVKTTSFNFLPCFQSVSKHVFSNVRHETKSTTSLFLSIILHVYTFFSKPKHFLLSSPHILGLLTPPPAPPL